MTRANNTRNNFANIQLVAIALGLIVVTTILLTTMGVGLVNDVIVLVDKDQRQLFLEREQALQDYRIAAARTKQIVNIGLQVGIVGLLLVMFWKIIPILTGWLAIRSRVIKFENGLAPLIIQADGQIYDPNRAIGENPVISLAALQVQGKQALASSVGNITLNTGGNDSTPQAALTDTQNTLPAMLPVSQVGQSYTLDSLTIGQSEQGLITESLYNLMHLLSVGSSGWGKSSLLRYLLFQFAQCKEDFDIYAIDINGSEFNLIQGWSKLLYPVARETNDAIAVLQAFSQETQKRKALYENYPTAYDLPSYNQLADSKLNPQIILIDEGTNLLNQDGIGEPLREAAQTSRQYGQYIFMTGQSAKASVLDTQTRDNFTSRLCFHTSKPSYRVVLDESVEQINIKGRCWAQLPGREISQVQIPLTTKQQLLNVLTLGSPKNALPEIVQDETGQNEIEERIKALAIDGLSRSQIEREVFGYNGGNAYATVKKVLG